MIRRYLLCFLILTPQCVLLVAQEPANLNTKQCTIIESKIKARDACITLPKDLVNVTVSTPNVQVTVPKDAIKVNVKQAKAESTFNLIGWIALVVSILSYAWTEHRTRKKVITDNEKSKNDLFWFRTIISPNLMEPLLDIVLDYGNEFNKIMQIEDEELRESRAQDFSETWDYSIQPLTDKCGLLSSVPGGAELESTIKATLQSLLSSFTHQLYQSGVAVPEDAEIPQLSTTPFSDASKTLVAEFKRLLNSL